MIEISHLSKQFGALKAVDDLSLSLVAGEILGFLGPNGAGKSTTMKMLTGFVAPTSGSINIHGHDIGSEQLAAQKLIGYLPEGAPCYDEMTPASFLGFIAEIRGFSGAEKVQRVADVVEKMSLQRVLGQRIETLSKGYKRRVGLAQAIIHDPKVLILDEPTDGLDPNQKQQVRELIRGLSKDKIVIISTHILEEVAAVCSRVVIISEGRLVVDCTPEQLASRSKFDGAVSIRFTAATALENIVSGIAELASVASVEQTESSLTVFPEDKAKLFVALSQFLSQHELVPESIFQERGRLDEVFRQVTVEDSELENLS
ncbi:MAG: ATP-binding cassette domain-containing protein [Pseudomonadales bacterium]|nr:ATP-binding cassette domain-containing protein [Pseudomonadales bacterium]